MKPKEGTILTVAKGIADKAAELAAERADDLEVFYTGCYRICRRSSGEDTGDASGIKRSRCCGFRRTGTV